MRIRNRDFFLNWDNQTRVSLLEGEELTSVEQLPNFLVECHMFRDGNNAESFIQGLQYLGLGNSIVIDWNPGSLNSNACVLIGRLDEDRPDTDNLEYAIKFVEHQLANHDSKAIAAGTARAVNDRRKIDEDNRERAKPIVDVLVAAGADRKTVEYFSGCIRLYYPEKYYAEVNFKDPKGPFRIETSCQELFQGIHDVSDILVAKAAEYGFTIDPKAHDISFEGIEHIDELPEKLVLMKEVEAACKQAKHDFYHQKFVESIKVTAARKRFLKAGWESGHIHQYVNRANPRARVGGEDIGQTEINVMLTMGWMVRNSRGYEITEEGAKAAGIDVDAGPRL